MTRKNLAMWLFVLAIIGRLLDVGTTYLYSPDLALESSPTVVYLIGLNWTRVLIVQGLCLLFIAWIAYRVARRDYQKPILDERLKLARTRTAKKRFDIEVLMLVQVFAVSTLLAFMAFLGLGLRIDGINRLMSNAIYGIPTYAIMIFALVFSLSPLLWRKYSPHYHQFLN